MKKLSSDQIRQTWFDFFTAKGHKIEKSASLIPYNDPTLLWINSGVAALKKYFDGSEVPNHRRIVNIQKCIRTNDIDIVGRTARHHTFFEMLGNFSIGDYFRNEALEFAFEILTSKEYFDIEKEKLYFTYYPGDVATFNRWKQLGVDESHLIPLKGNFWQIGEGPCGPNTEVFFDRGVDFDPEEQGVELLKNDIDNERYVEIWGIVFSQYNAIEGLKREEYKELPSRNIDTGAGLERFACILQGTKTNFETDLVWPIIEKVQVLSKKKYEEENLICFRVIADHLRAVTFALCDGEIFSNEGRGYVLRRLIRRASVFGQKLGLSKPFLHTMVGIVGEIYSKHYNNLHNKIEFISKMIKAEEEKFLHTLSSGKLRLEEMLVDKTSLDGVSAFKLYDTYGFPIEITMEMCEEKGVKVDIDGFNKEMENQRQLARNARTSVASMNKQSKDLLETIVESEFVYSENTIKGKVIALFKDGVSVEEIDGEGEIMFDHTTFYAESGGQVCDIGEIENEKTTAKVLNVIKAPNKQHLHSVSVLFGKIKLSDEFVLNVDLDRRAYIKRNHTAAHLLNAALTNVLGEHVNQQGSFVSDKYLRFDFNHFEKLNQDTLTIIENTINSMIFDNVDVETMTLEIEEAKKLGAKALFNEKYGDVVRVVKCGGHSMEFCGGTHVNNTLELGLFVIESEESSAAGVRRIVARTSKGAYELLKERENILNNAKALLNSSSVVEVNYRIKALLNELKEQRNNSDRIIDKITQYITKQLEKFFVETNGIHVLATRIPGIQREITMKMADKLKKTHDNTIVVIAGGTEGNIPIVVTCNGLAIEKGYKANAIMKHLCSVYGGSGGGKDVMANGKLISTNKIDLLFDVVMGELN